MIKCHINKKKSKIWVHTNGTAQDVMVESAVLIKQIFQGIHQENPEAAMDYKNRLLGVLLDPKTPVWNKAKEDKK